MTRFVSSTNETEAAQASVRLVVLADLNFVSGMIRVHDGVGPLAFGGNTYLGMGSFAGVQLVEESVEVIARGLRATLSGIPADLVPSVMTENYQNRTATFYLGIMVANSDTFTDTPEEIWSGRMDTMEVELDQGSAVITLNCEHRLRREPPNARMTNEDQQIRSPSDRFFDMLHLIPNYKANWGERPQGYRTTTGGSTPTPRSRNFLR